MSDDIFDSPKQARGKNKVKPAKQSAKTAVQAPKPKEWPSAHKPKLNFMPERHRNVEYGRRAVQNGGMFVLATFFAVFGASVWADAHNASLQRELGVIAEEVAIADDVLRQAEPITQFYANYVDQKDAVSHRFSDELSPSRVLDELDQLSGKSVTVNDMSYDLTNRTCLAVDPFKTMERTGCISITGEASSPSALAGFVDKVNSGSAMFTQARVTEARTMEGKLNFSLQTGYNAEAESNRGKQFTPKEEELAKVVKSIPDRFAQEGQALTNGQ